MRSAKRSVMAGSTSRSAPRRPPPPRRCVAASPLSRSFPDKESFPGLLMDFDAIFRTKHHQFHIKVSYNFRVLQLTRRRGRDGVPKTL